MLPMSPSYCGTPSSFNHLLASRSLSTKYSGLTCLAQQWLLGRVVLKVCHGVKVRSESIHLCQPQSRILATWMFYQTLWWWFTSKASPCLQKHAKLLYFTQMRQKHSTSSAGRETDLIDLQWSTAELQLVYDRPELFLLLLQQPPSMDLNSKVAQSVSQSF